MVINVFEAMQHPDEEGAEECMKLDVIDNMVQEVQEEEILMKTKAYYEETFATFDESDNNDIELVLQNFTEGSLHKNKLDEEESLKKNQKNEEENQKNIEELQEIQSIVQENQLDEVQADSATHMQPLVEELQLRKNIVQPNEDDNMQQKTEKERQQDNLLQQNIQEEVQQKT
ncbi:hypothetical protein PIB30_109048, partial [Stylosanthes scabra]|nr:hypothetical protein [Stylosanthes scabra]